MYPLVYSNAATPFLNYIHMVLLQCIGNTVPDISRLTVYQGATTAKHRKKYFLSCLEPLHQFSPIFVCRILASTIPVIII